MGALVLLFLLPGISVGVYVFVTLSLSWYGRVQELSGALRRAEGRLGSLRSLGDGNLRGDQGLSELILACGEVQELGVELRRFREAFAPYAALLSSVAALPVVPDWLGALPPLLDMAQSGARVGTHACAGLQSVAAALMGADGAGPQGSTLGTLARGLRGGRASFQEALAALEILEEQRRALPQGALPQRWESPLQDLDRWLPSLRDALALAIGAPEVLEQAFGGERPKRYLFLAQNSADLRATGGFITAIGLVTMQQGKVTALDMRNSYYWDDPKIHWARRVSSPAPMCEYMRLCQWYLRDANWWPDFRATAQRAEEFLRAEQGLTVDGVIAVDDWALRLLLRELGPVTIASTGVKVDQKNVISVIDQSVHYLDPFGDRKTIIGELAQELLLLLNRGDPLQFLAAARALRQALPQKHLLLYFHDPELQALVEEQGWSGKLQETPQDYLYVVDTNVGYSKIYHGVAGPAIRLEVMLAEEPGRRRNRLYLSYRNPLPQVPGFLCAKDWVVIVDNTCFRNYLRIYVPAGSHLEAADGFEDGVDTYDEGGKRVFAGLVLVPPRQEKEFFLEYTVPPQARGEGAEAYHLYVQKQPGREALPLKVTVSLPRTPLGATSPLAQGYATWETELLVDGLLSVPLK